MILRPYHPDDLREIVHLFYDTVHSVNAKDYTEAQLDAWAPATIDAAAFHQGFLKHFTLVAASDDRIVGFGDIDDTGYLDKLFVHKDYQRQGIARAIADGLENHARVNGAIRITVHASITAKHFFEKRGYRMMKEQQVERQGVTLSNFLMTKTLVKQPKEPT